MRTHDMGPEEFENMPMLEALQEARVFGIGDDDMFGLHIYELCDENFALNNLTTNDLRRLASELNTMADETDKQKEQS